MSLTVITLEKNSITQTLHKARGWEGLQANGFWSHGQNYANAAFPTTDWSCGSWLCSDTSVQQTSSEMLHQVFAWSIFDPGILLKTSTDSMSPRGRLVMADVRQLRWLQGWKDGHDRWSQLQDSTDFDQCIWDPRIAHEILWTKKKPAVCSLQMVMFKWRAARRLLAFAKCHIEDSMVGACNHAVSFPKCGLELFPWWRLFGYFPRCGLIALPCSLPTWIEVATVELAGWPATPIASSSIALPLFSPDRCPLHKS